MRDQPSVPKPSIEVSETQEGTAVRFVGQFSSLQEAYVIMSDLSCKQDGRPIAFRDLLPGIDLHVQSRWRQEDGIDLLRMLWQSTQYLLNRLIESGPTESMLTLESAIAILTVSRAGGLQLPNTAMQLRWL